MPTMSTDGTQHSFASLASRAAQTMIEKVAWSNTGVADPQGGCHITTRTRLEQPEIRLDRNLNAHKMARILLSEPVKQARGRARVVLISLFQSHPHVAEAALIYMVLHSRPRAQLSQSVQATLVDSFNADEVNWAMKQLIKHVFDPLMKRSGWIERCREARRKFGFDFRDEAPSHLWEKIHRYQDHDKGLGAWMNTTLVNHWRQVRRKLMQSIKNPLAKKSKERIMTDAQWQAWLDDAPQASKKGTLKFSRRKMLRGVLLRL